MALVKITKERYDEVRDLYFKWKELNTSIKAYFTRGVNLHEAITETICCYANDFFHSTGAGSEDAVIPETQELVQIKGTSNWDSDLTSFGPKSQFEYLHFVRLNQEEDKMYLYDIPTDTLKGIKVNASQTFEEQQLLDRRPRFSVINQYIRAYEIEPYAIVHLETGYIEKR